MKIGIIGCGNMGQALLRGIIAKNFLSERSILCCDKDRKKLKALQLKLKVSVTTLASKVIQDCDVIVLAVKPQDVQMVLRDLTLPLKRKLLISICAGISTSKLEKYLGKVAVIRIMPNMPAQIAQGVSAISLGKYATAKNKKIAKSIFTCIGEVTEVREELMDAVTAISGSGPAYFFYLVEKLIAAAVKLGISRKVAQTLAIKTALGSAMLLNQSAENAQTLRKRVTSKGGTTAAAFAVFNKKHLEQILNLGFKAAAKRSKEISRG